jgi:hypothetical protein
MLRRIVATLAVLLIGATGWMVFVLVAMRTKSPSLLRIVRRFNRVSMNKVQLRSAGTPGAYASVIRHRGRTSRREYTTPVVPFATGDDHFVIVLPYGPSTDWVQNVLAAGSAELVTGGATYALDQPELIAIDSVRDVFPTGEQRTHRMFRVEQCLRLRRRPEPETRVGVGS